MEEQKKRGRKPANGVAARSAAERMSAYRSRLKTVVALGGRSDDEYLLTSTTVELLAIMRREDDAGRFAWLEYGRRNGWKV